MHRFFVEASTISKEQFHSTDKELCHQVSKVLKMRAGKSVILCDNKENEHIAEWTTVSRSVCEAKISSTEHIPDISSKRTVHLFVAPLKNQARWEHILEKATEIGAASFTPLLTKRTESEGLRKPERLERIIKEAAEQSGRTLLPQINPAISLNDCLESEGLKLIPTLHEDSKTIPNILNDPKLPNGPIHIFIGPAGGFTEEEIQAAIEHNFYPITLGNQVLRTETAAIASTLLALQI